MKLIRSSTVGKQRPSLQQTSNRSGVSLAEVLVSMLIMSIGVVSVASLFPIAVLRTAQATQLTHAVFLRHNAQAWLESNQGLLSNQPQCIPFPNGVNANTDVFAVVDPLGALMPNTGLNATNFAGLANVRRTTSGFTSVANARQVMSLPDSWSMVFEDVVVSAAPLQVTTNRATSGITPNSLNYRVVLTDVTGKYAVIKVLTGVAGKTLSWGSALPAGFTPTKARVEVQDLRYTYMLTVQKNPTSLASATNLSNINWVADVDVAVFFNRSFKASEETVNPLTYPVIVNTAASTASPGSVFPAFNGNGFDGAPGVSGVDDDGDGTVDNASEMGFLGSDDRRTVTVPFAKSQPYLRKGSFMLEGNLLEWYRIVDFNTTMVPGTAIILLDRDVRYMEAQVANPTMGGVFMKGIVDVFPMGSLTGQQ